ncbi:light-induced protein, chloroplastic-like protein [Tanacetum coccineum]
MAGVTQISQFPTDFLSTISHPKTPTSRYSLTSLNIPSKSPSSKLFWGKKKLNNFTVRAEEVESFFAVADEVSEVEPVVTEIDVLKKQLVDSFYGTNRGLSATSETRAEVVELITQLEAKNPTAAPTEALPLLNGKWILAILFSGSIPSLLVTALSFTVGTLLLGPSHHSHRPPLLSVGTSKVGPAISIDTYLSHTRLVLIRKSKCTTRSKS